MYEFLYHFALYAVTMAQTLVHLHAMVPASFPV